MNRAWQAFLRRFDIEHMFRFLKQHLGWTRPKLRDPAAADRWTWLVIAAYAQLHLARGLAADIRLSWQQPCAPGRLTPARVRRGFRRIRQSGFRAVTVIWADGGYAGKLVTWAADRLHRTLQIIRRPDDLHTFKALPRRWVVERTFGWIMKHRRCVRDYERLPEHHEAYLYWAMIHIMAARAARRRAPAPPAASPAAARRQATPPRGALQAA